MKFRSNLENLLEVSKLMVFQGGLCHQKSPRDFLFFPDQLIS